jgi:osmotically-inducible protein OsmY
VGDFGRHNASLEHFDTGGLQHDEEDDADRDQPASSADQTSPRTQFSAAPSSDNPYADNPFQSHYYQSARALKQQNVRRREMQADVGGTTQQPQGGYDAFLNNYSRPRAALGAVAAMGPGDTSAPADMQDGTQADTAQGSAETTLAKSARPGMSTGSFDAHLGRAVDPFARPGPKGYVRSDERLHEEICECLIARPRLDIADVTVTVAAGKVVLDGSVPDRHTRFAIEDIAEDTWGVKAVENRLRVREKAGALGMHPPGSLQ